MKRNKRNRKFSRASVHSIGVTTLIVTLLTMTLFYWTIDSRGNAASQEIGKAEKRLSALQAECEREIARWDEMKTPDKLSEALARFGLDMEYPEAAQKVRMGANGRPVPGQIAVLRARGGATATSAMVAPQTLTGSNRTHQRSKRQ